MVIESLKQSWAVRTKVEQLLKRLPDGMNNLYRQKLQSLEEHDREMLLIALRWLMCSEGRIEVTLVADDVEHCYEDFGYDGDDLEYEDGEDSENNSAVIGVSTGVDPQEECIDHENRESIARLKTVGRDFLKFSSGFVDIQHKSVRDFVDSEKKPIALDSRVCPECLKRMNQDSTYQASPQYGHLIMVKNLFRKLMSPSFQENFIIIKSCQKHRVDAMSMNPLAKIKPSGPLLDNGLTSGNVKTEYHPDNDIEYQTPEMIGNLDKDTEEKPTQFSARAEEADSIQDLLKFDSDQEQPPRYELAQWPRHLRAAEEAWPADKRDAHMQERWDKLYSIIEAFLSPESLIYKCWSRRLSLWGTRPLDPLHVAAKYGLLGMMQRYISYGTDVNVLDEDQWTPLHFACWQQGNNVGIEMLVVHQADVNALTNIKQTPLYLLAGGSGSEIWFQYLLDHGANPEITDEDGWSCLHVSAGNRNLELCKILLGCNTIDINAKDSDGETPLHWMFLSPNASSELVKLFLDHGATVNEQNNKSEGPLYLACLVGNFSGARLLLDYHADIDDDDEVFGKTALHAAVEANSRELVKLLVERGADVSGQDKMGRNCFAQAAATGKVDIIEYLLDTWSSQDSTTWHLLTQDLDGRTPLHLSVKSGTEKAVELLLKAGDAATLCSQSDRYGATPLHLAAAYGSLDIVEILLNSGADPIAKNNKGHLPLDAAFIGWKDDYSSINGDFAKTCVRLARLSPDAVQKIEILGFAIEKGVIELSEALAETTNSVDAHGWTPKMLADHCGHHEISNILSQSVFPDTIEGSRSVREAAFVCSPSRWSALMKHPQLNILGDGLDLTCSDGKLAIGPAGDYSANLK